MPKYAKTRKLKNTSGSKCANTPKLYTTVLSVRKVVNVIIFEAATGKNKISSVLVTVYIIIIMEIRYKNHNENVQKRFSIN